MKIVAAAVQVNGQIYKGKRHHECIRQANADRVKLVTQKQQGFLLDDGSFVSRSTAALIAYDSGQISKPKQELDSYDLW